MRACTGHPAARSDRICMNETDFIRQQLAAERAHLRAILGAVQRGAAAVGNAPPVVLYVDWASRRLMQQYTAHQTALATLDNGAAGQPLREGTPVQRAEQLLALLEAGTEPLDARAGRSLRVNHWRQAAGLSADSILEERQLYAAARGAVGLA
jgi:hypothetical protein